MYLIIGNSLNHFKLFKDILTGFYNFKSQINENKFNIYYDKKKMELFNFINLEPNQIAYNIFNFLNTNHKYSYLEL